MEKYKYQNEISQMMFVAGEIAEPKKETTELVEDIVRSQLIEIIIQAVALTHKRNSKTVSAEDLIFLIRHDKQKVYRLRAYLTWKEVRKRKDEVGPTGPKGDAEELVKEAEAPRAKKRKIKFSWDILTSLSDVLTDDEDDESEIDEEELEANEELIQRLKHADEVTKTMSKEEYMYFSECRQSSFTFKKSKRFRDWCHMGVYYDNKPAADVVDILGFLACEMVTKLTETALVIKKEWENRTKLEKSSSVVAATANTSSSSSKLSRMTEDDRYLFKRLPGEQAPLEPGMMLDAFRRLQKTEKFFDKFRGGVARSNLSLI
ncbi:Transcription initiation protein spt3 [Nowakowskiella sp. JEL0407]|nr:Transcription initiation protein spt3 [Nowakowskiella sp. JEL0407]